MFLALRATTNCEHFDPSYLAEKDRPRTRSMCILMPAACPWMSRLMPINAPRSKPKKHSTAILPAL